MSETLQPNFNIGERVRINDGLYNSDGTIVDIPREHNNIYKILLTNGIEIPTDVSTLSKMQNANKPISLIIKSNPIVSAIDLSDKHNIIQLLNFAIEFVTLCEYDTCVQYTNAFTGNDIPGRKMYACGFTAPLLAAIVLFFKHNNIKNMIDLQNYCVDLSSECGYTVTPFNITLFLNDFVGEIWNNHFSINTINVDYLLTNKPHLFNFNNILKEGCNIISFANSDFYTFHHSFIYVLQSQNKCFIIDSWAEEKTKFDKHNKQYIKAPWSVSKNMVFRPISMREFELSEIEHYLKIFNKINNNNEKTKIIKYYFLAPYWKIMNISDAIVVSLKQDYFVSRIQSIFLEVCFTGRKGRWGGKSRKTKTKTKTRKSKTKKIKIKKTKS